MKIEDVSDYCIAYFNEKAIPLSHLKLQKILYYSQAWYMVNFKDEMLFSEVPQAWVNGPVYPSVYDRFKAHGVYTNLPEKLNFNSTREDIYNERNLPEQEVKFLEAMLNHYSVMSEEKLVLLTHSDSPWNIARGDLKPWERSINEIDLEGIKDYYTRRVNGKKEKHSGE